MAMLRTSLLIVGVIILTACTRENETGITDRSPAVPFVPVVSINEIMVGQIDHAANFILELGGNPDQQLIANAWEEVEHHAIQLVSSTSALTMGGSGENDAMWIAQPGWREFTQQFGDAASMALQAARRQDLVQVQVAGEALRAVCDACHAQYKQDEPTQGFYRSHNY
ncbi:MAG: cytochrome c [Pseudohongiellaceae bacterium]